MCASLRPSLAFEIFGKRAPNQPLDFYEGRLPKIDTEKAYIRICQRGRAVGLVHRLLKARDGLKQAHMDVLVACL